MHFVYCSKAYCLLYNAVNDKGDYNGKNDTDY